MVTMIAVDLGAQSGRVALGRFDGEQLEVAEVHRFPNVPVRVRGTLHWDVLRLFGDVLDGLRAASRDGGHVDSVGVDSWAVDFGLLDRRGELLRNPVHYRDARRAAAFGRVLASVPARELYERTGIQLIPINTVFELAAMAAEHDPALDAAETLLMIPDLLHHWLGGPLAVELTNATTTQCYDPRAGGWALDVLERLGIPARLFPAVVEPATVLGPLAREVAQDVRLEGASIVAGATHDTAAAVAAVPFRRRGSAYVSAGTWSLVGLEVEEPVVDERTFAANLTNEGGVAGTVRLLRNVTGLWLLHECQRAWALEDRREDVAELLERARAAPPLRSLVDPDDPMLAEPGDMPARISRLCAATGQPQPEDDAALVRCILESIALAHARAAELLREATGAAPSEIHVVGGGARNELLCRFTASAAGVPVLAGPAEATTIGNLAAQAIALGELSSLEEARELVRASFEPEEYEPEQPELWREAHERFAALGARVEPLEEVQA